MSPTRLCAAAALAILGLGRGPAAAEPPPPLGDSSLFRLEVVPETNGAPPYPHELVLLKLRGYYRPLINLDTLIQPALPNFGWSQLGADDWSKAMVGGFEVRTFERTIALYPESPGSWPIDSFTHRLTIVDGVGRKVVDVKSPPTRLDVATWTGPKPSWWLPARNVVLTETWDRDPNRIPRGELARLTVTIEAEGVPADQLPPLPKLSSPGIISFAVGSDRETTIGPRGPSSRATYRWDMRPISAFPATLAELRIPWFDTTARKMRDVVISSRRMAWAVAGAETAAPVAPPARPSLTVVIGAGLAAFAAGAALLLAAPLRNVALALPRPAPRELRQLRTAARRRDASGARAAIAALARREPDAASAWRNTPTVRAAIAALDRHLFSDVATPSPDLRALARGVTQARREAAGRRTARLPALAPLDGPRRPA